ncbi:MAG: hypothetical protein CME31_26135 [Gimesia sp.]|nr:hypothetical protein [Gimesia sp.]
MHHYAQGQPLNRSFNAARLNDRKYDELKRETGSDPFSVVQMIAESTAPPSYWSQHQVDEE